MICIQDRGEYMLDKLNCSIKENKIITNEMFKNKDFDKLLDLRDESVFDDAWIKAYNDLEQLKDKTLDNSLINQIRKEIFLKTYDITQSSEIAECISDDFELIIKAYSIDYNNEWLNAMVICYIEDVFPCGKLGKTNLKISEVICQLLSKG